MAGELDKFWNASAPRLRRGLKLHPLCQEEAEQECRNARPEHLPDDVVDAMISSITSGDDDWVPASNQAGDGLESGIDEDALQLNRNAGAPDDEVDERVDQHRKRALGIDDQNPEDKGGLADPEEPPREGR